MFICHRPAKSYNTGADVTSNPSRFTVLSSSNDIDTPKNGRIITHQQMVTTTTTTTIPKDDTKDKKSKKRKHDSPTKKDTLSEAEKAVKEAKKVLKKKLKMDKNV